MSDEQRLPDDEFASGDAETQRSSPTAHVSRQAPQTQHTSYVVPPRHARRRKKNDSVVHLPWWSLLLMLLFVVGISFGIVALVLAIGGNLAPASEPRIVIITSDPTNIPAFGDSLLPSPTPPPSFVNTDPNITQSFALTGPTLEPISLTPTEIPITIGALVVVTNVAGEGQNIRAAASIVDEVIFVAPEGTRFLVIGGPTAGSGLTWWHVQNVADPSETGWAAAIFLVVEQEL